jgi:hypothetical protein
MGNGRLIAAMLAGTERRLLCGGLVASRGVAAMHFPEALLSTVGDDGAGKSYSAELTATS